ncbi:MAG: hypothetical protein COC19_06410 [SAR86 cluster bacterium]|uniref:Gluconate 2-dehydrogenase subunit 3 family protein n=1 Tax=SAR86 cluster bacterium TaxID=2030880 RepID=A0A2A4MJL7_9GAMM|nr:MAG: hypothetical protein COC19_06410 [SAR86 cluster bacterium]
MSDSKHKNNKLKQLQGDAPSDPSRRSLLKNATLVGAGVVGSSVVGGAQLNAKNNSGANVVTDSATQLIPSREALEVLTGVEAETLEAICDCLIPSDANGPGAKEARAVHYIDRALASHNSDSRANYAISLNAIDEYARKTRGKAFALLIHDQQESILAALQANKIEGLAPSAAGFFNLVRSHTIDGTFSDPYYGGNRNFVGWDMLKYPGLRLSTSESDVALGRDLPPSHQSAYDHPTYTKAGNNNAFGGDHV